MDVEENKRLLQIFSENRSVPIVDKDVDDLVAYLTLTTSSASSSSSSSKSPTEDNNNNRFPTSEEGWTLFRNVTINSLSLCLDIFENNGVLSEKQKKKIVFHGLLQLGSSLSNVGVDREQSSSNNSGSSSRINSTSSNSNKNSSTQSNFSLVTLLQNALEIILSTAMLPSDDDQNHTHVVSDAIARNNNNKNTTIGIEMLLTPYLSLLQRYNIPVQPYLTRICTNTLNPINAAALINSILALNQSNQNNKSNPLITDQMVQSFTSNLINCLYDLAKCHEYDSIPPLIYQICQLIDGDSGRAQMTMVAIASFLNSLLDDTSFQKGRKNSGHNLEHRGQDEKKDDDGEWKRENEIKWTIFTSLNHLGNVLRSNPLLPGVLLKILEGKRKIKRFLLQSDTSTGTNMADPPFRYLRMTAILLAMGLTMAAYIPRMRDSTLNCIRDLVLEEEMIRVKRTKSDWFNACAAILLSRDLQMDKDQNFILVSGEDGDNEKEWEKIYNEKEWEKHVKEQVQKYHQSCSGRRKHDLDSSYMLGCIKNLLSLTNGSNNCDNNGDKGQGGNSHGAESNSDLYPPLVSLGFLLIDTVKKDTDIPFSNKATAGVHTVEDVPTCTALLNQNSNSSIQKEAHLSTAAVGRKLLKHLFLHAGMGCEEDDVVIGNGGFVSQVTLSPLCRSILMTMFEKFCGMAPNSIEHSYLLRDIAYSVQDDNQTDASLSFDDSTKYLEKAIGAGILEEFFLPMIIDSLSNVPGGGMPPAVALVSIIPTLHHVLRVAVWKAKRNRHKQNELDDHLDHCFLLAKKALFCTDIERRKVAVHLLIMLINIASERSENGGVSYSGSAVLDEARGYLRRCLTQHQCDVRLEVYASLVSQMSKVDESDDDETTSDSCQQHSAISQILFNHLERYITIQEEDSVIEARRKRAIQLGTHLSQQADYSDDDSNSELERPPLRLDMCTKALTRHSSNSHQLGVNAGRKKKQGTGTASLIADAVDCILEPISFLLASSVAVIREAKKAMSSDEATEELTQTLRDLRSKVSKSKLEQYLQYFDRESKPGYSNEYTPRILSTCILVASVAETLMAVPSTSGDNELMDVDTVEKLFRLRSDAVKKGSVILATLATKTKSQKKTKTKKTQKKKKAPAQDETKSDDDNSEDEKETSTNEATVKPQTLQRAMRLLEDTLLSMSPSQSPVFLSKIFRECGILSQPRDKDDVLHHGDTNDLGGDDTIYIRLKKDVTFRRFLLEKTESLLQGRSLVIRAGDRFDCSHSPGNDDSIGLFYLICSLQLGPVLLSEFCSHVQCRDLTSLTDQSDCPLAQVALNAFVFCVQRMTAHVKGHNMNNQQRLSSLLKSSIDTLCSQFPSIKTRLEILVAQNKFALTGSSGTDDEKKLIELIIPFLVPLNRNNNSTHGGLLFELVANGLDGEAVSCCNLLTCILKQLGPSSRQLLGMSLLRCFNDPDPESTIEGLLDLQHDCAFSSNNSCGRSSVRAIDAAMLFDGQLDSLTHVPGLKSSSLVPFRTILGFADSTVSKMNQLLQDDINPSQYEKINGNELLGTTLILSQSFITTTGINSVGGFKANETKLMEKIPFLCTVIVATKPSPIDNDVSKDLILISSTTLPSILDKALVDAEFLCTKVLPLSSGVNLSLTQEMLACRLIAVVKTINALAPGADSFDNQAMFVAFLLKCAKRLHIAVNKLVSSYSNNSSSILLKEARKLLTLWSGELNKRTASLLLLLQERNRTQDGKVMTDSKIDSHGRTASMVVFEKERTDSTILKLSAAKLKSDRSNDETKFLQEKILVSTHRGFKIQDGQLQSARERTAKSSTKSSSSSKKRKATPSKSKSRTSKKRAKDASDASDADADSNMEDSSDDEDVIKDEGSIGSSIGGSHSIGESHTMLEDDENSRTQESDQHTLTEMEDTQDDYSENES